ncbi:superoxide dismutase [Salipaludibacillus aurantiacus]|uniref:superoxide dismutase n=1 Tax=Salipaludibacillus aurantiacus TaxID=1601833 RepID=A0A1H9V0F9_9BACI|nr:superoxide dismutase [Salipaludibacillus aurantiacus]SES14753.1 superoxide dismutase, Fe-Mn family [Salipaludibacillus aurantiacus]
MDVNNNWNLYVSEVDEWMTRLEKGVSTRSEDPFSHEKEKVMEELETLKKFRGKLLEDEQNEKLQHVFTQQVSRLSQSYEHWRSLYGNSRAEVTGGNNRRIPPGEHRLPPLPYSYDALEPVIAEEIMKLHHQEHHQSYVDGLNKAEMEMKKARETDDFDLIRHWEREAAFHGAGHYLHTMFWKNMSPAGGGKPSGQLLRQITQDFGSFEAFKRHFSEAANKVQGVGWALLVWAPRARRLEILQAEFHHLLSQQDMIPLLGLDVWEHAYYLQYKNNRGEYVDNFWKVIDWDNVAARFKQARQVKWEPY